VDAIAFPNREPGWVAAFLAPARNTRKAPTMKRRKNDLAQPPHLTTEEWVASLMSAKRDMLAQIRRSVHTTGNMQQSYMDRLDRALALAKQ
jgi:hypothetical protein